VRELYASRIRHNDAGNLRGSTPVPYSSPCFTFNKVGCVHLILRKSKGKRGMRQPEQAYY
ncbi:hypothetical protein N4Q73_17835, partial [Salmonella enterica subsp. enterica serovar Pomona]|uniref:hypothetical protein n=1 Tax=Salmonella enterica TaxID=28901 RepID=UPI00372FECBD